MLSAISLGGREMRLGSDNDYIMTPAEYRAIEVHKYYLSEQAGHDVGFDCAVADWERSSGPKWRRKRMQRDVIAQIGEIEKHKWIESEKAGYDLGDVAAFDWVVRFAGSWRDYRERQDI